MKKIIITFIIGSILLSFSGVIFADSPVGIKGASLGESSTVYRLLAPLSINGKGINCIDTNTEHPDANCASGGIGDYLNIIFKLSIGLCAVLAVIMIVVGGIQWMGEDSVFGKVEAKSKIGSAILGLLIALGAYALLNTINPDLLGKGGVNIAPVEITIVNLPDAGDTTVDPDFKIKDGSYGKNIAVSTGTASAVEKLKQGWEIDHFKVYTNNRMLIALKKGSEVDNSNLTNVNHGAYGFSEPGQAKSKDFKTPKGTWKILNIQTPKKAGVPVYNGSGSNMGASFWLLNPTTSGERGIGMHGDKAGTLTNTAGCIRMTNSDILALLPYVKPGIPVIIGD